MYKLFVAVIVILTSLSVSIDVLAQEMFLLIDPHDRNLAQDGIYILQDLGPQVLNSDYPYPVTTIQSPLPGTQYTGPQVIPVTITGTDSNGIQEDIFFTISLLDVTPPELELSLLPVDDVKVTPGNIQYFVAPIEVRPFVSAQDESDPNPAISLWVDGEPWTGLLPVTSTGLHTFIAKATDSSGNFQTESILFDIREMPLYKCTGIVEDIQLFENNGYVDRIEATILLASQDFDDTDILLSTSQLWLLDESYRWLKDTGISIEGAYPGGGSVYDHTTCQAQYQNGYWRIIYSRTFSQPFSSNTLKYLDITGSGRTAQGALFEIRARMPAIIDVDPIGTLSSMGLLNNDQQESPNAEAKPPCRWTYEWVPDPTDHYVREWSDIFFCDWEMDLLASGEEGIITGSGYAYDDCMFEGRGGANAVSSGGTLSIRLEPANCCDDCEISVVARPKFKVNLEVNPPAQAAAGGKVSIASPCGDAEATGGAAIGDFDQGFVEFFGYTVPVYDATAPEAYVFSDNLSCVHYSCSIQVSILLDAWMHIWAESTWFNWVAWSKASITDSTIGLTVTPSALCSEIEQLESITINFPEN